jgi:hypothetical protein
MLQTPLNQARIAHRTLLQPLAPPPHGSFDHCQKVSQGYTEAQL